MAILALRQILRGMLATPASSKTPITLTTCSISISRGQFQQQDAFRRLTPHEGRHRGCRPVASSPGEVLHVLPFGSGRTCSCRPCNMPRPISNRAALHRCSASSGRPDTIYRSFRFAIWACSNVYLDLLRPRPVVVHLHRRRSEDDEFEFHSRISFH